MKNIFISRYILQRISVPHGNHRGLYKAQSDKMLPETHFPAFEVLFFELHQQ